MESPEKFAEPVTQYVTPTAGRIRFKGAPSQSKNKNKKVL